MTPRINTQVAAKPVNPVPHSLPLAHSSFLVCIVASLFLYTARPPTAARLSQHPADRPLKHVRMLRATTGPTRPTSAQTSRSHDKTTHYHAYLPPILDLASPFSEPHVTLHTIPIPHQQHSSESIVPLEPPRHVSKAWHSPLHAQR
jgi:hypothetical protein